jgi:hypothetical protein
MKNNALDILQAPTPPSAIKYLPKNIDTNDKTALALPYINARFVQQRLDEAFGPLGWQTDVKEIRGFVCVGIGIQAENGAWIWRWDTGQEDQNEASGEADAEGAEEDDSRGGAKAIFSRGLKRCGVQLGIGRDIYDMPKRRRKISLSNRGKWSGWAEDVTGDARPQSTNGGAKPAPARVAAKHESVVFADFAREKGASQDQIAASIAAHTVVGKTDWTAARADLAKALDDAPF